MTEDNVLTLFNSCKDRLNSEIKMREKIKIMCKEHHQLKREITIILQAVHYSNDAITPACLKAREKFGKVREIYIKMQNDVPYPCYYKFYDQWRITVQKYCYLIALTIWLETETMAKYETVAEVLNFSTETETNLLYLDTEDYIYGLLNLCTELARLALSSVMKENYSRPLNIFKSVMEVNIEIGLLDIKNDHLRKRIDALKYDVKKIEEIIYDLSLRGLLKNAKKNAKEAQEKALAKGQEKGEAEGKENGKAKADLKNGAAKGQEKGEAEDKEKEKAKADLKNGAAKGQEKGEAEGKENGKAKANLKNEAAKGQEKGEAEGQENGKAEEDLKNAVAEGKENGKAKANLKNEAAKGQEKGEAEGQENGKAEEDLKNAVAEGQENVEAEAGGDADKKPELVVDEE